MQGGGDWFRKPVLRYPEPMKSVSRSMAVILWAASLSLSGLPVMAPSVALAHGAMKSGKSASHHVAKARSAQAKVCYRLASGVIVLEQMPNNAGRLGRGSGFAPIGEAVFRSNNRGHACSSGHGRRG